MASRIAPSFQTPKKMAAASGVGGRTTATRSPRPTPRAASVCAAAFARPCSSPQFSSRVEPSKLSQIIAGFSRGCLSQTSVAMLYRGGTSHRWAARISSYVMRVMIMARQDGSALKDTANQAVHGCNEPQRMASSGDEPVRASYAQFVSYPDNSRPFSVTADRGIFNEWRLALESLRVTRPVQPTDTTTEHGWLAFPTTSNAL